VSRDDVVAAVKATFPDVESKAEGEKLQTDARALEDKWGKE